MHEIRIHGRGGQGAVLASTILAKALVEEGRHAVAIPSFGFERRGAPVAAFLRCADQPIRALTNIYAPDIILCIDTTVGRAVDIFAGMKPGGTLVQATGLTADEVDVPPSVGRVGVCDAVGLAQAIYGRPITNTIMLGACARATGLVSLEALESALEQANFRDAGLTQNIEAVRRGYHETTVQDRARIEDNADGTAQPVAPSAAPPDNGDLCPVATRLSPMLPGDWRALRPVVAREKCVKCAVCWTYCPTQCVVERPAWFDIDLRVCKGCGVCAQECPQRAIAMIPETDARP